MKRETDRAFLLRSANYRESDRILTLFLERLGRISAMAKGARKSWRRFGGALEPFSLFEVTVVQGKGNLWRLDESTLQAAHHELARNLEKMSAASFVVALLRELTPENEPEPGLFRLTDETFHLLEQAPPEQARVVALAAELRFLFLAGIGLGLSRCNACGTKVPEGRSVRFHPSRGGVVCTPCGGGPITLPAPSIAALIALTGGPLSDVMSVQLAGTALHKIEDAMDEFVSHHLGKSIRMKQY